MARKSFFLRACKKVEENKKTYKEKAEETKQHSARLAEMQRYVDMSPDKRLLLLDIILNGKSSDSNESLLKKGVIVYVHLLDVLDQISKDLTLAGVKHSIIQGSTKDKKRGEISKEFKDDPSNKVILISDAAGESLNLNGTNELILYDLPKGYRGAVQTMGRVARSFSKFEAAGRKFYIHYVIVDETLDEYSPILLSSKKELEEEILHADNIQLKEQGSFDGIRLKEIRKKLLWKTKKRGKL